MAHLVFLARTLCFFSATISFSNVDVLDLSAISGLIHQLQCPIGCFLRKFQLPGSKSWGSFFRMSDFQDYLSKLSDFAGNCPFWTRFAFIFPFTEVNSSISYLNFRLFLTRWSISWIFLFNFLWYSLFPVKNIINLDKISDLGSKICYLLTKLGWDFVCFHALFW